MVFFLRISYYPVFCDWAVLMMMNWGGGGVKDDGNRGGDEYGDGGWGGAGYMELSSTSITLSLSLLLSQPTRKAKVREGGAGMSDRG